jgi:multicomponent Na+:H+ antiporter subunit D
LGGGQRETAWLLLLPPLATSLAVVLVGVFAEAFRSPLSWVRLIAGQEYLR